ncbi:transcriptional regulatory protein dep1 [Diplodia corticola]|uniref:Transcriptional regulatory protein dep1 n=1 Tax=Diplodia corticola TaxID=236234 RepID=A0A1J9QK73_9PEZI|nr:transcriptional regulatory protein dep1 [Diplodia corticola]OJD29262.1 transcriptional regulatory protein dep1 [Diplodia corticola]
MHTLHRSSRSRSKTAPETGAATTTTDTAHSTPTHIPAKAPTPEPLESPEPASPPLPRDVPHLRNSSTAQDTPTGTAPVEALATMSADTNGTNEHDNEQNGGIADVGDEGSSSLSEPEESIEDRDEAVLRDVASPAAEENDSEAETERIDSTPRKSTRTATDVTNGAEGRSPSKLAKVAVTAEPENLSQSPALPTRQRKANSDDDDLSDEDDELPAESKHNAEADAEDSASPEGSERKRKRSSSALSSIADDLDNEQPSRKRPSPTRPVELNGDPMDVDGEGEEPVAEERGDHTPKEIEEPLAEGDDNEETAQEATNDVSAGSKKSKGKKGQRKGRKGKSQDNDEHAAMPQEAEDDEAHEAELEGEDSTLIEEERGRKHNALEELNKIEKQFLAFQKKRLEEQLDRLSLELDQLRRPDSTHHEYLLMLQAVDKRRDEKTRQEEVRLGLKKDILRKQYVAMRNSVHGQYMHDIAELRMDTLSECNKRVTQLQRERRYWGTNERDYSVKFTQKRSQQVQQQTAYNLEVSILSGIAKHVGFPAAPDLAAARVPETDQDLAAMGIPVRTAPPPARPAGPADPSHADRAAAEEQFFEQNAWANPQHPAHTHNNYQAPGSQQRAVGNPFATPAAQRDRLDLQVPNGSASTIDMQSNPPSGTAREPTSAAQRDAYESPIVQIKQAVNRTQGNRAPPVDTPVRPGSHPSREAANQADSSHHRAATARDIYDNPGLMSHLSFPQGPPGSGGGGAQSTTAEGDGPSAIKDEDAGEQLQRAAITQQRTTGVVGGLFR